MPRKTKNIKVTDKKKSWNRKTIKSKGYHPNSREKNKYFLIICEGENTEPEYFKSFPLGNAHIESYGLGSSKTTLVEHVIKIVKDEGKDEDREVWVVFDMDLKEDQKEHQKNDYNNAIRLARENNFYAAYSNDAFELWFVLHYQYIDSQLLRFQFYEMLSKRWNLNYEKDGKGKQFCRSIYEKLQNDKDANQDSAIKYSETLLEKKENLPYADQNPCTTVFKLVRKLNKYIVR